MRGQKGASAMVFVALVGVGAAGAAAYYAWEQKQSAERNASELATTRTQLAAASAEARTAREQAAAAAKALDEHKQEFEQLRAERDSARAFLDAEKAHTERLRAELALMQQQLAFMRSRGPASAYQSPSVAPMTVQPRVVRAVPAQGGAARSAARAAPVPAPTQ